MKKGSGVPFMQVLYRVSQRVLSPHSPPKLHDLTLSQVVISLTWVQCDSRCKDCTKVKSILK